MTHFPRNLPAASGGTIVGMPRVTRREYGSGELEAGPCSDPFHPERWSNPPAMGLDPIVPCDEPEEDESGGVVHFAPQAPTPAPFAAVQRAAAQPRPVVVHSYAEELAREPVSLPFGTPRARGESLRLFVAGMVGVLSVGATIAAAVLLLH